MFPGIVHVLGLLFSFLSQVHNAGSNPVRRPLEVLHCTVAIHKFCFLFIVGNKSSILELFNWT